MTEPCIPPMRIEVESVLLHEGARYFCVMGEFCLVRIPKKPAPHDPRTEGLRDHTPA